MLLKIEIKKLVNISTILIIIALILFKLLSVFFIFYPEYPFPKDIYKKYAETLSGMTHSEQSELIANETLHFESVFAQEEEMKSKYNNFLITFEEFSNYNYTLTKAKYEHPAFLAINDKYEYFEELYAEGESPKYFYDLETIDYINRLQRADYLIIAFAIFSLIHFLSINKEYKMHELVVSSVFGREKLMMVQIRISLVFIFITAVISSLTDFYIFFHKNAPEYLQMPLNSMETFASCKYDLTVWQCITLILCMKVLWSLVLVLFIFFVQSFTNNKMSSIYISFIAIFLPILIADNLSKSNKLLLIGTQLTGFSVLENSIPISVILSIIMSTIFIILARRKRANSK